MVILFLNVEAIDASLYFLPLLFECHTSGLLNTFECISYVKFTLFVSSLVFQTVKNLPVIWETWVQYLGWEDPLEKGMATHSSIIARRIPQTEEP